VENLVSHYVKFGKEASKLIESYYWQFKSYLSSQLQTAAFLILLPQYTKNSLFAYYVKKYNYS